MRTDPEDPAPLPARVAAALIDAAIAAAIGGGAAKLAGAGVHLAGFGDGLAEPLRKLTLLCVFALYCVCTTAGPRQATLGQRWLGLCVVGADGARIGRGEAFARWLAFLAAALPVGAGLWLALGPERRPFQDRLCASRVVVRARPQTGPRPA